MVLLNYAAKEVNAKVVYYGPGLSGKTTNLQYIHDNVPSDRRGKMVSLATEKDRTLFFDLLPLDVGKIRGFNTRIQLYTVPGQVHYNSTRKLVLTGVDAVVFVADSEDNRLESNIDSIENLKENLSDHGLTLDQIPWVIQYNKQDLDNKSHIEELNKLINPQDVPYFLSCAITGDGVFQTLKAISKLVLRHLSENPSFNGSLSRASGRKNESKYLDSQDIPMEQGAPSSFHKMELAMQNNKLSQYSLSEFSDDYFPSVANRDSVFLEIPLVSSGAKTKVDSDTVQISTEKQYSEQELQNIQLYSGKAPQPTSSLIEKIQTEEAELPSIDDIPAPQPVSDDEEADFAETASEQGPDIDVPADISQQLIKRVDPEHDAEKKAEQETDDELPDFLKSFVEQQNQRKILFEKRDQAASEFIISIKKFNLPGNAIIHAASTVLAISAGLRGTTDQLLDLMEEILDLKHKNKMDQLDQALSEAIMRLVKYKLSWQDLLYVAQKVQNYGIDRKITERLDRFQVRYDPEGGQIFYVQSDEGRY